MPSDQTPWVVKGVPERIRRYVKAYAAGHGLTMADALEFLIDTAAEANETRRIRWHDARIYFKHLGQPIANDAEAAPILARAAEIKDQLQHHREPDLSGLDVESLIFAGLVERDELYPDPAPSDTPSEK